MIKYAKILGYLCGMSNSADFSSKDVNSTAASISNAESSDSAGYIAGDDVIRIATRNSPLALWQANFVQQQLIELHPTLTVEIVGMTTKGDQLLDRSLAKVGGKGLFLKELELSLLAQETDIAVHSMKDVPVSLPEGLEIAVVCPREEPRDAFVSNHYHNLAALPAGSKVGTSSLRRVAQLKTAFPNLEFVDLRGNVNTRLRKLDDGEYDAIILAAAGLIRLGFEQRISELLDTELCLPAVGQGIVGIECRSNDARVKALLAPLQDERSHLCLTAERALNEGLDGGCQVPVAAYAQLINEQIQLSALVADPNGGQVLQESLSSDSLSNENADDHVRANQEALMIAQALGQLAAQKLLARGAAEILSTIYTAPE